MELLTENRWCDDYKVMMCFYGIGFFLALISPRRPETWKKHAGKLSAGWLFFLIVTVKLANLDFHDERVPDRVWHMEALWYLALSAVIGFMVSRLVTRVSAGERRFELMASGLSEALWSVDCEANTVVFADTFPKAFGYRPDEITNTLDRWRMLVHEDDAKRVETSFDAAAAERERDIWEELYRVRCADGRYVWVLDRCRFDRDESGRALMAYGGMLDVSDRVEGERKLRELNAELESRVAIRTRELERANRELASFTYAISHDLKSPLSGILGYADLMAASPVVAADAKLKTYLKHIVSSGDRMSAFIRELLDHSAIDKVAGTSLPVPLAPLFEDLRAEFSPQIGTRGGRLSLPRTSLAVTGAEQLVYRILQNLIGNAFKYQREGVSPTVVVSCEEAPGRVILSVKDNGMGIPADVLPQVFDFQFRVGGRSHIEGHGIGLANVKKAVLALGGEITVSSTPGQGSVFRVELPSARV